MDDFGHLEIFFIQTYCMRYQIKALKRIKIIRATNIVFKNNLGKQIVK